MQAMEQIILANVITLNSLQPRAKAVLVSNRFGSRAVLLQPRKKILNPIMILFLPIG